MRAKSPALRIRFWGVRGSHPTPGPATVRVGGNSSCVEVATAQHTLVFDAGTGLIGLGRDLMERPETPEVHIFLSHLHHDHIEGLRFFAPAYAPEWTCYLYGPAGAGSNSLPSVLAAVMGSRLFPVDLSELAARVKIKELRPRARVSFNGLHPLEVEAHLSRAHPKVGVNFYRVNCDGRSVVYATDVESRKGGFEAIVEFARHADVLIHDAQYTDEEYEGGSINKAGWGHSTVRQAAEAAKAAGVGELLLFHHDPAHDDAEVRRLEKLARSIFPKSRAATEGLELKLFPVAR